jgi:hypothetical protein
MSKSLAELRDEFAPVEDTLPCGLDVLRHKNIPFDELLIEGLIPTPLLGLFDKSRKEGKSEEEAGENLLFSEQSPDLMRMINGVFKRAIIRPEVVDDPVDKGDSDRMWIKEPFLDFQNKMYVFSAVTEGVMSLSSFRDGTGEPAPDGESPLPGESVQQTSE